MVQFVSDHEGYLRKVATEGCADFNRPSLQFSTICDRGICWYLIGTDQSKLLPVRLCEQGSSPSRDVRPTPSGLLEASFDDTTPPTVTSIHSALLIYTTTQSSICLTTKSARPNHSSLSQVVVQVVYFQAPLTVYSWYVFAPMQRSTNGTFLKISVLTTTISVQIQHSVG